MPPGKNVGVLHVKQRSIRFHQETGNQITCRSQHYKIWIFSLSFLGGGGGGGGERVHFQRGSASSYGLVRVSDDP